MTIPETHPLHRLKQMSRNRTRPIAHHQVTRFGYQKVPTYGVDVVVVVVAPFPIDVPK